MCEGRSERARSVHHDEAEGSDNAIEDGTLTGLAPAPKREPENVVPLRRREAS